MDGNAVKIKSIRKALKIKRLKRSVEDRTGPREGFLGYTNHESFCMQEAGYQWQWRSNWEREETDHQGTKGLMDGQKMESEVVKSEVWSSEERDVSRGQDEFGMEE